MSEEERQWATLSSHEYAVKDSVLCLSCSLTSLRTKPAGINCSARSVRVYLVYRVQRMTEICQFSFTFHFEHFSAYILRFSISSTSSLTYSYSAVDCSPTFRMSYSISLHIFSFLFPFFSVSFSSWLPACPFPR